MATNAADRVQQTTTGTGTGPLTPTATVTGMRTWAAAYPSPTGSIPYLIEAISPTSGMPTGDWESGLGTWNGTALVRDTVSASSNAGAAVNFAAGTKTLSVALTAAAFADKADTASVSAAVATAAADATSKANTAQANAIGTASADATSKANAAQAAASTDATTKANAAQAAAIASANATNAPKGPIADSGLTLPGIGLAGRGTAGSGALRQLFLGPGLAASDDGTGIQTGGPLASAGFRFNNAGSMFFAGASVPGGFAVQELDASELFEADAGRLRPKNLTTDHFNLVTQGSVVASTTVNQASALAASRAQALALGKRLWLPKGQYLCEEWDVDLTSGNPEFLWDGPGELVYRHGTRCIRINGEWGAQVDITSAVASVVTAGITQPVTRYVLTSAAGFQRDDVVKAWCDSKYPIADEFGDVPFWGEIGQVITVDSGSNALNVPLVEYGATMVAATNKALRKMIPHEVDIAGMRIRCLDDPYTVDNVTHRPAVELYGLVRPRCTFVIPQASGAGVYVRSCYDPEITAYLGRSNNRPSSSGVTPILPYGIHVDRGTALGRYKTISTTGRHAGFSTGFDDGGGAFSHANFESHGLILKPDCVDSFAAVSTGTAFDTHFFCVKPRFKGCIGIGNFNRDAGNGATGSGTSVFNHRAIGPTFDGCVSYGGSSGFNDTSGDYANWFYPSRASYRDCIAMEFVTQGFLIDGTPTVVNTAQHVELIDCEADGNYGAGSRGTTALEIRECSRVVLNNFRARSFNSYGIRIAQTLSWTGTTRLEINGLDLDFANAGGSAAPIQVTTEGSALRVEARGVKYSGSATRPINAFIVFPAAPTDLPRLVDVEFYDTPISVDRPQLALVSGAMPAAARLRAVGMGAGLDTAYGTAPSFGDADITILPRTAETFIGNTVLTALRTATIATGTAPLLARKGDKLRIGLTDNATGFPLKVVGTGFASFLLFAGEMADLEFDGAGWRRVSGRRSSQASHLAADVVTTSATSSDSGLQFWGLAGETYSFDISVFGTCSTASGSRFQITAPAGSTTRTHIPGNTTSASSYNVSNFITAINTDSSVLWALAATELSGTFRGTVTLGADGPVKLGFRSNTGGDTTTLRAFSSLRANRVA